MKIALVCSKFPPDVGGGETHIRDLAAGLAARGHDVRILTGTPAPDPPPSGIRWTATSLPMLAHFASGAGSFRELMPALYAWLRDTDPDVIHSFNCMPTLAVSMVRRSVRAPLVISLFETLERGLRVFDMWRVYDLERAVQGALLAASAYDLWVCDSEAYVQWALESGADESRIWRGDFCVDGRIFAPPSAGERAAARAANGIGDERTVVGFPSRLVPRKGFEDVLHGLAVLRASGGPRPTVLIPRPTATSDSPYYEAIFALIRELGLEDQARVTHHTYTVATMPVFYAACDFAIQPARAEGLGIALLEAMSMGIPVLCSRVEGHTEVVVDGETGFLFQPGDPADLARALERALAHPAEGITGRARRLVEERFSPRRMIDSHERAYLHVMSGAQAHAEGAQRIALLS